MFLSLGNDCFGNLDLLLFSSAGPEMRQYLFMAIICLHAQTDYCAGEHGSVCVNGFSPSVGEIECQESSLGSGNFTCLTSNDIKQLENEAEHK